MGGGISVCFALVYNEDIIGGAVLGKPRHEKKYKNCIDIRRLACIDETLKNTESYFLSKIIWWVKKNTNYENVISYADATVGHSGGIYKAANFLLIGETARSKHVFWNGKRYHPRSLTIERPYSYRLREAIKTGEATQEEGLPKTVWIYKIKRNG